MEEQLGAINSPAKTSSSATASPGMAKDQSATWDVNVTHYMETYAIPNTENEDYRALQLAILLMNLACVQDAQLKELTGAFSVVLTSSPLNRYTYMSVLHSSKMRM